MTKPLTKGGAVVLWVLLFTLISACATYYQKRQKFQQQFQQGNLVKAENVLDNNEQWGEKKSRIIYFMDRGVVAHLLGKYEISNEYMNKADRIGERFRKKAGLEILSYLSNPTITQYKPEDYELVMIHYYKALNYLMLRDYEAALVESRKINIKLNEINDKRDSKVRYNKDAFAHTLMGVIYEATGDYNNAFIAYRNAYEVYRDNYQKHYGINAPRQLKKDLMRSAYKTGFDQELRQYEDEFNMNYQPENSFNGELVFFWTNGLGPVKAEWSLNFTVVPGGPGIVTFKNEKYGLSFPFPVDDDDEKDRLTDLRFVRVAFPKFQERPPVFQSATLQNGKTVQKLELLQDVNQIAIKNLRDRMLRELGKGLLRLASKQATEQAVRKESETAGMLVSITNALTEKADTRNWQTLPFELQYTRFPFTKEGEHTVQFTATGGAGSRKVERDFTYNISKGKTVFQTFRLFDSKPLRDPGEWQPE